MREVAAGKQGDKLAIQRFARLAQRVLRLAVFAQNGGRLWMPEQPSQHHRIDMTIRSLFANLAKDDASAQDTVDGYHSPPLRHDFECRREMAWRNNQRCPVDDFAIRLNLMR